MEGIGKKPLRRRSITAEFKAEIVEIVSAVDPSAGQAVKGFDLTEKAVPE